MTYLPACGCVACIALAIALAAMLGYLLDPTTHPD
jgi:hypothetical protein